jgi:hypothetical protein
VLVNKPLAQALFFCLAGEEKGTGGLSGRRLRLWRGVADLSNSIAFLLITCYDSNVFLTGRMTCWKNYFASARTSYD